MQVLLAVLFNLVSATVFSFGETVPETTEVTTKNGVVRGIFSSTVDRGTPYIAFLGIPFAQPPVGKLRFQSPQPPVNWSGILDVSTEKDMCLQSNFSQIIGSEDCLYLNVYVPYTVDENNRAVMVWIHGGGFATGNPGREDYGPDYFLNENVVVVAIAYRLGVLGYLSTEDETIPGNFGLKDQVMALKWARENIGNFGGAADKVTIFGQSAGGASVAYLLQSKSSEGLFRGAIMQSGTTLSLWSNAWTPKESALELARKCNITTNDSAVLLEKLREMNVEDLQREANEINTRWFRGNPKLGFAYTPTVESQGENSFIDIPSYESLSSGTFHNVSVMIGFNSLEVNGPGWPTLIDYFRKLSYDELPQNLVPVDMEVRDSYIKQHVGELIRAHYFGTNTNVSLLQILEFLSDNLYVRPLSQYVKFVSKKVPTYVYEFSYVGERGKYVRGNLPWGVAHNEDSYYLFDKLVTPLNVPLQDDLMRYRLVKLWTNFAKTGNPTPFPEPLLQNIMWSAISPDGDLDYLDIDKDLTMRKNPRLDHINFWNDLFEEFAHKPYFTY